MGQFPLPSLATVGGVPLMAYPGMSDVELFADARKTAAKAYDIIGKKGYTAFGVATAVETIVDCVLNDQKRVLPVSVRVPGRTCCLSLPSVVGISGIESIRDVVPSLSTTEKQLYDASVSRMEDAVASLE